MKRLERLQTEYADNGHFYRLYLRNDIVAIYEQIDKDTKKTVGYELFEILIRKEEYIKGVKYNRREVRPSTSMWGTNAFTLSVNSTQDEREIRFKKLTDDIRLRKKLNKKSND